MNYLIVHDVVDVYVSHNKSVSLFIKGKPVISQLLENQQIVISVGEGGLLDVKFEEPN